MSPARTIGDALEDAAGRLRAAQIDGARRDARLLVAEVLAIGPEAVLAYPELALSAQQGRALDALVARRAAREPLSRILGRREFWGLAFRVTPATLDPRPDSETLVDAVLASLPDRQAPLRVLDLGTGSGCLLLALLSELPAARGLGIDRNGAAVKVARDNAKALGLEARAAFRQGNWAEGLAVGPADGWQVIVSNPPYIRDDAIAGLAPEVARYEPRLALAGGADGLDAYRALAPQVAGLLAPDGLLALELGAGQAAAVEALLSAAGLRPEGRRRDLAGIERCLLARRAQFGLGKKSVGVSGISDYLEGASQRLPRP